MKFRMIFGYQHVHSVRIKSYQLEVHCLVKKKIRESDACNFSGTLELMMVP